MTPLNGPTTATQKTKPTGWTCRRCDNGDHYACEMEVNGVFCVCVEGACGET